jgi:hypothetical protein
MSHIIESSPEARDKQDPAKQCIRGNVIVPVFLNGRSHNKIGVKQADDKDDGKKHDIWV